VVRVLPRLLLIALLALLAACPSRVREAPESGLPALPPPDLSGATVYRVSSTSEAHVLVFRGGALARLGHNHVMTSRSIVGRVWLHSQLGRSGFELTFPVDGLIVDDPDVRRAAGSDFPPEIPQADRDGTRRNMLRTEVLDGERYPMVTLRSARVAGALPTPTITVRVTLKTVSREIDVPATVTVNGTRLSASGEFDLLQSDFGIEPFSIGLGALSVQDRLHVRFNVVAEKE
jgi:hypothetical protein